MSQQAQAQAQGQQEYQPHPAPMQLDIGQVVLNGQVFVRVDVRQAFGTMSIHLDAEAVSHMAKVLSDLAGGARSNLIIPNGMPPA